MKASASRPISSPGRAEKFPPPLMRFLRTNVGSKSRGRSRSSPMFMRRQKSAAAVIESTQPEPSSPKVTCIGQVRVRRSSKTGKPKTTKSSTKKQGRCRPKCCGCSCPRLRKTLFCCKFSPKFMKPRSPFPVFRKWAMFFRFGYCKKVDTRDDSSKVSSQRGRDHAGSCADSSSDGDVKIGAFADRKSKDDGCIVESCPSPPKNALLLTRCRSAPYRSSSLASRFWGSPIKSSEETGGEKQEAGERQSPVTDNGVEEKVETETPFSPNSGNAVVESRDSEKCEESEGLVQKEEANVDTATSNEVLRGGCSVHPLLLTRCKSEPARTGERLNPETSFWRQRRSADEPSSQPKHCD